MSDRESRTEKPTPRRLLEARREGKVARSQDLNAAILLLAVFAAIFFFGRGRVQDMGALTVKYFDRLSSFDFEPATVGAGLTEALADVFGIVMPIVLLVFTAVLLMNVAQVGFLFTTEPLRPDGSRLSPMRGLKRILSSRGATRTVFAVLKIGVVGAVLAWTLFDDLRDESGVASLLGHPRDELAGGAIVHALDRISIMGMRGVAAFLVLATLEYVFQRRQFQRDLMMTRQEVREEMRQMEGDPEIKRNRQSIQRKFISHSMLREVPGADVVIDSPPHLAVALRFEREAMAAPRCVAKGRDQLARRICELAMEHGVPVVQRSELASALYRDVEVGEEVPGESYRAVAEILAFTFRLARRESPARDGIETGMISGSEVQA